MTVIAYKDGVLACDSKLSGKDSHYWSSCKKIKKIKGYLIGTAGSFGPTEFFMAKFDPKVIEEKRFVPLKQSSKEVAFEAIIITPKGKVLFMEEDGIFAEIKIHGHIAIGSGEVIAMAAMDCGATAVEAVKIAIKRDISCGGRVQYVKLRG